MYTTILVACLVGLSMALPKKGKTPTDSAMTIDEAIMRSYQATGIKPSGLMEDHEGNLISGLDMVVTPEQYMRLHGIGTKTGNGKSKRKAISGAIYRWTDKTIPYDFNYNEYRDYEIKDIKQAMKVYMKETCLVFRPATAADKNKIYFQNGYGGCNSQLGMRNGTQAVNLDSNGCRFMGLYLHEIGHALGLVHEHQLPDRGQHVTVLWHNVDPKMKTAFYKYQDPELERFGIPYDITSIMHYGIAAFGYLGAQTIKPHDSDLTPRVGRVFWKMLSFSDVKIINKMYKCDEKCGKVDCPGEGFVNKECQCVTPQSYYKSHCYNVQPDDKCLEWVAQGECQANAFWMGYNCRKACDECPKYGVPKKQHKDKCYDKYYDDEQCKKWASKGYCNTYDFFMKRKCTKTCNACGKYDKCSNTNWEDKNCDLWAKSGECTNNPIWMKLQCADSCDACGYRQPGQCSNIDDDAKCTAAANRGECDDTRNIARTINMLKNCAKACASCSFNQGKCKNEAEDSVCEKLAAEGDCNANPAVVKRKCRKTCDSCGFGIKGNCKNPHGDDKQCEKWADTGECDGNPGFMKKQCARDCNTCEWLDPNGCFNAYGRDKVCDDWQKKGECENNPVWMHSNCAKSCGVCGKGGNKPVTSKPPVNPTRSPVKPTPKPSAGDCKDDHENCPVWAQGDGCKNGAGYMDIHCRKSCGYCTPVNPTPKPSDCTDDHENCPVWAQGDGCTRGAGYMDIHCRKSCGLCTGTKATSRPQGSCKDNHQNCPVWAQGDGCKRGAGYMDINCKKSCGLC